MSRRCVRMSGPIQGGNKGVRPGWAGLSTLFGCPVATLADGGAGRYLAAGVPFDATASSRPGAAEGPEAIRRASRVFGAYLESLGERDMLDTRTGRTFRYVRPALGDLGDLPVYATNLNRHFEAVAAGSKDIAATGATPVFLGGDHSVSVPLFVGVARAWAEAGRTGKLGYVQVDHHFDFGDHSEIHGALYHGSNARRISELPGMVPALQAFVGVGDVTRKDQFEGLVGAGYWIVTAASLRREGAHAALAELVGSLERSCEAVYLSIDIDVLDAAEAPGTGNVTFGGLRAEDLFDAVEVLGRIPPAAIDLVEVAPRYDPTGRTAQLAARLLFELLYRQPDDR